jgi:succinate dehydrogenase/fumarate reductase flavoprotein subunit
MKSKSNVISRRDFLKGASAGAVGVAAITILGGCAPSVNTPAPEVTQSPTTSAQSQSTEPWYGTAPEIADSEITETLETEILICGAGHAGMIAALAAADQGAKTLVIEKNPTFGVLRSWLGVVGSKAQNDAGVKIDKTEIVQDIARYGSNYVDQKLIQVWANESGEAIDWLGGKLAEYNVTHVSEYDIGTGYAGIYKCWPTHTKFLVPPKEGEPPGLPDIRTPLTDKAQKLGAEFKFSTPLVKLIRESGDAGKVTGVIAKNADGKYIKVNASKAVLICTGGYGDDLELLRKLNPSAVNVTTMTTAYPGDKGDGIKAGIWAGGVKAEYAAAMLFNRGFVVPGTKAGLPFAVANGILDGINIGSQPFLKVNMDGKRYCSESVPYDFVLYPLENEKNGVQVIIWDANYWQNIESFHTIGCSRMVPSTSVPATGEGMGKDYVAGFIAAKLGAGVIQQADTIEELATKLQLPPENLKATVEKYNTMAAAGVDTEFGKDAKDLIAVNAPPFYGATVAGQLLTTMDGLKINTNMQVLDASNNVIEGLYAAGDVAGGFFAHNYPELAVGIAAGKSLTFSRHAVLHILGKL